MPKFLIPSTSVKIKLEKNGRPVWKQRFEKTKCKVQQVALRSSSKDDCKEAKYHEITLEQHYLHKGCKKCEIKKIANFNQNLPLNEFLLRIFASNFNSSILQRIPNRNRFAEISRNLSEGPTAKIDIILTSGMEESKRTLHFWHF